MISLIRISGYKLIEDTEIKLSPGLNVITGETGAGKTIFVKGLLSAFGLEPLKGMVEEEKQSFIEVVLEDQTANEGFLVLRRESTPEGRVLSFIDGRLAKTEVLKELSTDRLVIHSQNSTISLLKPSRQLEFLDTSDENLYQLSSAYKEKRAEIAKLHDELKEILKKEKEAIFRISEIKEFIEEVEALGLQPGQEQQLKEKRDILRNFALISEAVANIENYLRSGDYSAIEQIGRAVEEFRRLSAKEIDVDEYISKLSEAESIVNDVCYELLRQFSLEEVSIYEIEDLEKKLFEIQRIKRKYDLNEESDLVLELEKRKEELLELESSIKNTDLLQKKIDTKYAELVEIAEKLSLKRKEKAEEIEAAVNSILEELKVGKDRFRIRISSKVFSENQKYPLLESTSGFDEVSFEFRTENDKFLPIAKVASGGELSRLMLALESMQVGLNSKTTSYIFDEVDTGIGGKTAVSVGKYLKKLSKNAQVICITHLPQIAVFSDKHFIIEKSKAKKGAIKEIRTKDERINEIARMLSGDLSFETAKIHAQKLLEEAMKFDEQHIK